MVKRNSLIAHAFRLLISEQKYRTRGVLGTSASSHALSLALHGKKFGIPVTIIAPENVHPRKLKLYDRHGARTYFAGRDDNEVRSRVILWVSRDTFSVRIR